MINKLLKKRMNKKLCIVKKKMFDYTKNSSAILFFSSITHRKARKVKGNPRRKILDL